MKKTIYKYGSSNFESKNRWIVFMLVSSFVEAWMLMLLLGILAGYTLMPGLAIGYWASLGISNLWGLARGSHASTEQIEVPEVSLQEALLKAFGGKK